MSYFSILQVAIISLPLISGSSNFAVLLNGSDLMVNEIGAYQGSQRYSLSTDGYYGLVITADGKWSVKIEK